MADTKILEKIKKLFELSKNNPSEEEAKSAALKAQELLVEHGLTMAEVDDTDITKNEKIEEVAISLEPKKWKYTLAGIIANNFKVKHFYCGKDTLIFYGHSTDATVASETYKYLFKVGNALGNKLAREARQKYGWADNVYNSCVIGFCQGIREALAEQSKALMVITPADVEDAYADRSKGFKKMTANAPKAYNGDAFRRGREQGYNAMRRNALPA